MTIWALRTSAPTLSLLWLRTGGCILNLSLDLLLKIDIVL
jgi:hypothetical protein